MPRWRTRAPVYGVAAFLVLYAFAAGLYPGGSKLHRAQDGFSVVDNYWCDLLDDPAYDGRRNPARFVGVGAMVLLGLSLAVFWWDVAALYPGTRRARLAAAVVRSTGIVSGATAPLVATRWHDHVIDVAGGLGFLALFTTTRALRGSVGRAASRSRALVVSSRAAVVSVLATYAIWRSGIGVVALPLVQKGAFVAFLAWVVVVCRRMEANGASPRTHKGYDAREGRLM